MIGPPVLDAPGGFCRGSWFCGEDGRRRSDSVLRAVKILPEPETNRSQVCRQFVKGAHSLPAHQ